MDILSLLIPDKLFLIVTLSVGFTLALWDRYLALLFIMTMGGANYFLGNMIAEAVSWALGMTGSSLVWPMQWAIGKHVFYLSLDRFIRYFTLVIIASIALGTVLLSAKSEKRTLKGAIVKPAFSPILIPRIKSIKIGAVNFPLTDLVMGMLICGVPGSGKTEAFHQSILSLKKMKIGFICFDYDGELVAKHYRPGDTILDLRDRNIPLSIFGEIKSREDCARVARALMYYESSANREWVSYAISFLTNVLIQLWEQGIIQNAELVWVLRRMSIDDLREFLKDQGLERVFEEKAERFLMSVLAVLELGTRGIDKFLPDADPGMSISSLIVPDSRSTVWVVYDSKSRESSRPLCRYIALLAFQEILSFPGGSKSHYAILIDELTAHGELDSLADLLALVRKKNGLVCLGFQQKSQLVEIYGEQRTESILNCVLNKIYFRAADTETAKRISDEIGVAETVRDPSSVMVPKGGREPVRETSPVILPSEIQSLKPFHAFVRTASSTCWYRTKTKHVSHTIADKKLPDRKINATTPCSVKSERESPLKLDDI